jgi:NTP pyrophosphatase (non-canonical NTP hydrolase)
MTRPADITPDGCYRTVGGIMLHKEGCDCPDLEQYDAPVPNRFDYESIAQDYLMRLADERGVQPDWYHMYKLWEEAGEVPRAYLKWQGLHRTGRTTEDKFAEELADVVISAFAVAHINAIDLDAAVQRKHTVLMTRAMKEGQ